MTRDDTRAFGAKGHRETNYERFFFYAGKGGGNDVHRWGEI